MPAPRASRIALASRTTNSGCRRPIASSAPCSVMVKPGLAVSIRYARASAISADVRAGVAHPGSLPVDGFGWYTTVLLAAHGGADGVAAASASGADESERATSD